MYKIHPIVVGTKVFDKSMMTYQYGNGQEYTIPIYCWYIEGGDRKILVDTGEMNPIQSETREKAIGGKIYTFEEGLARWNLTPTDIDVVIHTHLHNDHCENDYKCENAEIFVHEKELERIQADNNTFRRHTNSTGNPGGSHTGSHGRRFDDIHRYICRKGRHYRILRHQ